MAVSVIVKLPHRTQTKGATPFMSNRIHSFKNSVDEPHGNVRMIT